ncbi:MAG TPA: hypothetical protein DIW31_07800 [Bacteroidales bacterium]|nr:hypothetical protein [Bacteroidales bacterium]
MEVLVYTQRLTSRVDYTIKFIFEDILGVKVRITSSYSEAKLHNGVLISYCMLAVKEGIHIVPHSIMVEDSVERQKIELFEWEGLPAFFRTSRESDIPFDLFAATFYLISRYEEYLLFVPDRHNRFPAEQSIAYKGGFLNEPIVDVWAYQLVNKIKARFPSFQINPRKFEFIPTIDVDSAYAYRYKGVERAFLGTLRSLLTLKFDDFTRRILVYLNLRKDPYDIYENAFSILKSWPKSIWFVLVGRYARYDRNVSIQQFEMQNLLHRISDRFEVGVHPSYRSGTSFDRVKSEINDISRVLNKSVVLSRQHFLRFFLPITYTNLALLGIKEDYSMGYSECVGFRAGTCTPFKFYNIKEEKVLDIKVFPFQAMDFTLCERLGLTPEEALDTVLYLVEKVKKVNGTFVMIWHNEYLSGTSPCKGWENHMPNVLKEVKKIQCGDSSPKA